VLRLQMPTAQHLAAALRKSPTHTRKSPTSTPKNPTHLNPPSLSLQMTTAQHLAAAQYSPAQMQAHLMQQVCSNLE
jgi:hypothetical protein